MMGLQGKTMFFCCPELQSLHAVILSERSESKDPYRFKCQIVVSRHSHHGPLPNVPNARNTVEEHGFSRAFKASL